MESSFPHAQNAATEQESGINRSRTTDDSTDEAYPHQLILVQDGWAGQRSLAICLVMSVVLRIQSTEVIKQRSEAR